MLITNSEDLKSYCEKIALNDFITVDTEFVREKTYYPYLCLIQIGSNEPNIAFAIDMLIPTIDYAPLIALLINPAVTKVFHSARQDIEAILHYLGIFPTPIFDTQIAAMACGFGESVGYAPLVESLTGHVLDKKNRFSDWANRPLSLEQMEYALADVTYLREIYTILKKRLQDNHRLSWLQEEWEKLNDPKNYQILPEEAWKKVKINNYGDKAMYIIMQLASLREKEAQKRNIPRNFVLKDQTLNELAIFKPTSLDQLSHLRSPLHGSESFLQEICCLISKALKQYDPCIHKRITPKYYNKSQNDAVVKVLRIILKHQAQIHELAESLIASSDDLRFLAHEIQEDVMINQCKALQGWRYDVFGCYVLSLKKEELHISLKDGKLNFSSSFNRSG